MINITIKINSVDVTNRVQAQSLQVTSNVNQRRDSYSFSIKKLPNQSFAPVMGDEVEVFDGVIKIFGGVILSVNQTLSSVNLIEYAVSCTDYSHYLDRKLVLERYEDTTIGDIITDLLAVYAPTFTMANVDGAFLVASIAFNRITISDCIQKLADQIGYVWYVDYDKDIHFFEKNTELAPFNLTDTSGNYIWDSIEITRDLSQLKNSVTVEGGLEIANTRTETFTASSVLDERKLFRLANKFATMPAVEVQAVAQTVGVDYLDDDLLFEAMWNYNEKYIRFTAGNEPASGDEVTVTGEPLFPVIVRVQSSLSIGEFGVYEFVIRDKSIRSREEGKKRAMAELLAYQNGVIEGGFRSYTSGLRSGQAITITSPLRDIAESFLIQSVTFRARTIEQGEWNVKLATLRTIGIIDFLRDLLKDKEISENEAQTLLSFLQFTDEATVGDVMTFPSVITSGPYIWLSDNPADDASTIAGAGGLDPIMWNFFTWTT